MTNSFSSMATFLWSVADLLRGDFKQSQYGRIILPFTVLRRLECVLAPTQPAVLEVWASVKSRDNAEPNPELDPELDRLLRQASQHSFYNTSALNLSELSKPGSTDIRKNLQKYIKAFSKEARDIFDSFKFSEYLRQLDEANLLDKVIAPYAKADLSPASVSNHDMGLIFEDLIRRFAESSNETAGEHFTPRDIVSLTTSLVFADVDKPVDKAKTVQRIYDPTAGTGGFLSNGIEYLHEHYPDMALQAYGQELNPESYAICKADMLIKGQDISNIKLGNTLSQDQLVSERFDYCLSNPPFGVDWKKIEKTIRAEHALGAAGRFAPGLPRVSDGSLLFLLHLISKMNTHSRIGIILNGSPLFTGRAGSGESEIRRYILERDLLDTIVALPTNMFYNTDIATYIWILSNNKAATRRGKVLLIDATEQFEYLRKALGNKRRYMTETQIRTIVNQYLRYQPDDKVRLLNNTDFGYRRITIERPLRLAFYPRDADRLAAMQMDKQWQKVEKPEVLLYALNTLKRKYLSRETFRAQLSKIYRPSVAVWKLLVKYLSEQDDKAAICYNANGQPEADPNLRDYEHVPLTESVEHYFAQEVLPYTPDAWIDASKTDYRDQRIGVIGYEIPFSRYFHQYETPRALPAIDKDLAKISKKMITLFTEVSQWK